MKKRMLQIVLVVALVLLALALRNRDRASLPQKPEETVSQFFTAAGEGDDRAYLRLVTGELRKALENDRTQAGAEAFRQSLRRSAAGIKGLAVSRIDETDQLVTLDVEIVFTDRNERQQMLLERKPGGWVISAMEKSQRQDPPIPYGTPVFVPPDEGKPQTPPEEEPIDSAEEFDS